MTQREMYEAKMINRMQNEQNLRNPNFKFSDYFKFDRELEFLQKPIKKSMIKQF